MATALLFLVVIGWGWLLGRLVNGARQEVGLAKVATGSNPLVMFSWIPIVSVLGICLPRIFVGKEVAQKLTVSGASRRWLRYIRLGSLGYLVLLLGIPLLFAIAQLP
jgi:hypothetical protein